MCGTLKRETAKVQYLRQFNLTSDRMYYLCKRVNAMYFLLKFLQSSLHIPNQATSYLPKLHISEATTIKMVHNKTYLRLFIYDLSKNKGFKLYFFMEMPCRSQKIEPTNHPHDWKTFFRGNKLTCKLDHFDAKTSWNQNVWFEPMHLGLMAKMFQTTRIPFRCCIQ